MHIGIVGGLERAEAQYARIAEAAGHTIELHNGHTNARSTANLESLVHRADYIVILTDVNSHAGAQLARKLVTKNHKPYSLLRRCGAAHFKQLLAELEHNQHAA